MKNSVNYALAAILLGSATVTSLARADDEQARRQTYEQAREAIQAGRWEEARASFLELWKSRRTYDVALQLGQAEYNLKRYRDAAEHLAFGLMLLPPREKATTADRSQQLLNRCKQEVGAIDLRIKNKGADVLVDGQIVAESPLVTEVFVDPGSHAVSVQLSGHQSVSFGIQVVAGETVARAVELKPLVGASTAPNHPVTGGESAENAGPRIPPAPPSPPPLPPQHHASWLPIVAGGALAIAGISSGIGIHVVRGARKDEATRIRNDVPNGCITPTASTVETCHRLRELASDYDYYGRLELASFILGGAALLGSGTYFFLYRPDLDTNTGSARKQPLRFDVDVAKGSASLRVIGEL